MKETSTTLGISGTIRKTFLSAIHKALSIFCDYGGFV